MTTDYVPREVQGCCSGYGRPSEGHDINPPCATVVERQKFEKAVREAQARALEEAAKRIRATGHEMTSLRAWLRQWAAHVRDGSANIEEGASS